MKFYLNRIPVQGPWGGGNRLVTKLSNRLLSAGHDVVYSLQQADVYVCFDPRPNSFGVTGEIIADVHAATGGILTCRVGDVGTHGKPALANLWTSMLHNATNIIWPSNWARDYLIRAGHIQTSRDITITNGADASFFMYRRLPTRELNNPIRIVCAHWSDNPRKGFETYKLVDANPLYEFTYIGRCPSTVKFKHHKDPLTMLELADELPQYDICLTASEEEAGANHVLEAMATGLPIVYYIEGGSIPEYVGSAGHAFDGVNVTVDDALMSCIQKYDETLTPVQQFNRTTDDVVDEYMKLWV